MIRALADREKGLVDRLRHTQVKAQAAK